MRLKYYPFFSLALFFLTSRNDLTSWVWDGITRSDSGTLYYSVVSFSSKNCHFVIKCDALHTVGLYRSNSSIFRFCLYWVPQLSSRDCDVPLALTSRYVSLLQPWPCVPDYLVPPQRLHLGLSLGRVCYFQECKSSCCRELLLLSWCTERDRGWLRRKRRPLQCLSVWSWSCERASWMLVECRILGGSQQMAQIPQEPASHQVLLRVPAPSEAGEQ